MRPDPLTRPTPDPAPAPTARALTALALTALTLTALAGCDDGSNTPPADGAPPPDAAGDMAPDVDQGAPDTGPAADMTPDAAPDAAPDMAPPACDWPSPRFGDAPPALALADDPASCGQPAYRWIADDTLGSIVERVELQRLPAAALGALTAAADIDIPRPFTYDVVVEQIVYVTQDRGALVEATALVGRPDPTRGAIAPDVGLFALLHGTSGFSDDCAPSNTLEIQALTAAIASTGYVVVAPDFLGLKGRGAPTGFLHPYLVGEPTAISILDGVRAGGRLMAADGDACLPPEVVTLGISQGGHAALWTELLAPYYAAELELVGTVAAVPPSDLVRQMEAALAQRIDATFNALGLLVTGADWYGLSDRLGEVFQAPLDTELPRIAQMSCADDAGDALDLDDFPDNDSAFTAPILEAARGGTLVDFEPWGCLARENSLLHTRVARLAPDPRPGHGILFLLGERDELVNPEIERAAFSELCEGGWPLAYLECARAEHVPAVIWALPEIFDFIDARRAGAPLGEARCAPAPPSDCAGEPE